MSSLWYEAVTGGETAEACWELYHEISEAGAAIAAVSIRELRVASASWVPP